MALVDLVSDLSKFRSTVKSTGNTTPETSKAKSSKSFGALLPITEKLAQLATNVPKPTSVPMESRLSSTELDDVVKIIQKDLIINSVSKFSPTNTIKNSSTIGRVSIENVVSKFDDIKKQPIQTRLDKSDIVIIRSESGTNNLNSLVDINKVLSQSIDRTNSIPSINKLSETPDKSQSSPDINNPTSVFDKSSQSPLINLSKEVSDKSESSPNINKFNNVEDKSNQSPSINLIDQTTDKETSSPDIFINQSDVSDNISNPNIDIVKPPLNENKSEQSPDIIFNRVGQNKEDSSPEIIRPITTSDKSIQSPSVEKTIQSVDMSNQSPIVNSILITDDKSESSPEVFSNIRTPEKAITSPDIKKIDGDSFDNITDPEVEIVGKPLFFDRTNQSVLINKDIISPINNIVNPNIELDINVLTFDKTSQSPKIKTSNKLQGYVRDPQTKIVRIEQGTNHLIDESKLNLDGIPFRFVVTSKLVEKQTALQKDNSKYDGQSKQLIDNSEYNIDSVEKTNPSGRNNNPEKSGLSIKGLQSVNFFSDKNAKGFTVRQEKGRTLYTQNSEFSWVGSRTSPKITGNFKPFVETVGSLIQDRESKYKWEGTKQQAPSVNYFDVTKKNTSSGFDVSVSVLESKYLNDSSQFQWYGNRLSAPETNFFSDINSSGFIKFAVGLESKYNSNSSKFGFNGNLPSPVNFISDDNATGFINKPTLLSTLYKKDTSKFSFKGSSQNAPSVNYFLDTSSEGFTTFVGSTTSKYKNDSSKFSFKGNRQQSPSVDYFTNTNSAGFKNFAEELRTNYDKNTSRFTWVGSRQQAPEVDFFGIPGQNPKAISGFTKLFVDKTATKLSYKHSSLSFAGTTVRSDIKDVPFTKFFGFAPGELSGFMVGMQNRESSLYPILEPRLFADSPAPTRFAIETQRGKNKRQRTTSDLTKYVNVSLGGLPWFDGTNFGVATLDNQLPFIKTKVAESNGSTYFRKYEKSSKENTDGLGFLGKWATTRRSPSPLDGQYNKYKLQKESFNNDIIGAFRQPYIVRGIQRDGEVENQRWGFGITFDDGLVRGGAVTQAERIAMDAYRILQWTTSMKGILFNVRQVGLQLMNPNVDRNPKKIESSFIGLSATQIYNPIVNPMIINTVSARAGIHFARHGLLQFSSNFLNKYEDATLDRESNNKFIDPGYTAFKNLPTPSFADRQTNYNRLIGLMKELLPNSFQQVRAPSETGDPVKNAASRAAIELAKQLTGQSGIIRLSSNFGGPQSLLGIGGTQINRPKHPYLTHYTTTPLLMLTGQQKEPQYQESAKRDTYYAATSMYQDLFGDVLKTIAYNLPKGPYELNDENLPREKSEIQNIQPNDINRIEKQNPFEPKYDLFKNRLRAVTANNIQKNGTIADKLHPDHVDIDNPIKQYRSLAYDKLGVSRDRRRSRNGTTNVGDINDFREDLLTGNALPFSTDPAIVDYATQNLEDKFGFGKHGKVGANRFNPTTSNVHYGKNSKNLSIPVQKSDGEFRGDRINIIDYKAGIFDLSKDAVYETGKYNNPNLPGATDLIEFYFSSLVLSGTQDTPAEAIVFRAILGNIRDAHNGDWSPISYIGRGDPLYTYRGYTREISFDFIVSITSRDEMKATWRKLNHLASWTAPDYTKSRGFIKAPIIRLNIGHLYRKMPGFVSSIEYSFDNAETTWETAQLKDDMQILGPNGRVSSPGVLQLPKSVTISCNFTPIGVYRPEYNGIMYSLYDDTSNGDLETGLTPSSNTKVNYFRTFEVDNAGNQEPNDSQDNIRYYKIEPGKEDEIPPYGSESVSQPVESSPQESTPTNT